MPSYTPKSSPKVISATTSKPGLVRRDSHTHADDDMTEEEGTDYSALERILERKGCLHLLTALPNFRSMIWVAPIMLPSESPAALIISNSPSQQIVASLFVSQVSESWEAIIQFRSGHGPWASLSLADLAHEKLVQPFDGVKDDERKLTALITYYFAIKGAIRDLVLKDLKEFAEVMVTILRENGHEQQKSIENGVEAEEEEQETAEQQQQLLRPETESNEGMANENRDGEYEPQDKRSNDRVEIIAEDEVVEVEVPHDARRRRERSQSTPEARETDYGKTKEYLKEQKARDLLSVIPSPGLMVIRLQKPGSTEYKLRIGSRTSDRKAIYAYLMPRIRRFHDVALRAEDRRTNGVLEEVAFEDLPRKIELVPPFDSALRSKTELDKGDKARLIVLIKWYFIASDWNTDIVVHETGFPHRFLSVLQFLAQKKKQQRRLSTAKGSMKSSSATVQETPEEQQAPTSVLGNDSTQQFIQEAHAPIDVNLGHPSPNNRHEHTLPDTTRTEDQNAPFKQPTPSPGSPKRMTQQLSPQSDNMPSATHRKRIAEQVWFDEEQELLNKHRDHCAKYTEIEEQMEQLKLELDAMSKQCASSYDELLKHREEKPVQKKPRWMSAWDEPEA